MNIRLLVKQRSEAGGLDSGTEVLLEDEVVNLGRDPSCQVVLGQQAVSRSHARITQDGPLCFIEDLGSAFGTLVNGKSIPPNDKRLLRNGDVIGIAQFDVVFDHIAGNAQIPPGENNTSLVARQVVKDLMRGVGEREVPYFRLMNGGQEGQRIEVNDAQELIFGRDPEADVVLNDDLVSRQHAKVRRDWSGTHIEDLRSRNGIRVNGKRVLRKTLRDRDEVEVGGVRLLYLDPSEVREAPVVLPDEDKEEEPTNNSGADLREGREGEEDDLAGGDDDGLSEGANNEEELPPDPEVPEEPFEPEEPPEQEGGLENSENSVPPESEEDPDHHLPEESYPDDISQSDPAAEGPKGRFGGLSALVDPQNIVTLAAMGFFALLALAVMLAVILGA